jgi:hypothetical protein
MTVKAAKEKLHGLIDAADEEKIFELLSLLEDKLEAKNYVYDETTLNILRERSEEYLSGKSKTYTIEESVERIKKHREENGI